MVLPWFSEDGTLEGNKGAQSRCSPSVLALPRAKSVPAHSGEWVVRADQVASDHAHYALLGFG